MLRVLKYKPPVDIAEGFRQGLLEGHKAVVYPVLEWLLKRMPDLKKRAYLAKFLVKVEVRNDFLADPEVSELYEQVKRYQFPMYLRNKEIILVTKIKKTIFRKKC